MSGDQEPHAEEKQVNVEIPLNHLSTARTLLSDSKCDFTLVGQQTIAGVLCSTTYVVYTVVTPLNWDNVLLPLLRQCGCKVYDTVLPIYTFPSNVTGVGGIGYAEHEKKGVEHDTTIACLDTIKKMCQDFLQQQTADEITEQPVTTDSATQKHWMTIVRLLGLQPQEFHSLSETELVVERGIQQFEEKFLLYGSKVLLPRIQQLPDQTPKEQEMKRVLSYPFDAVRNNSKNPLRNLVVAQRIAQKIGVQWNELLLYISLNNSHNFAYGTTSKPERKTISVGFAPLSRILFFPNSTDHFEEVDMIEALKELLHLSQHERQRQNLDWYIQFYNAMKPRVIIDDEYQTYGYTIEALNLLLDGALRKAAEAGTDIQCDLLMESLHAGPKQKKVVDTWRQLAASFYPEGDAVSGTYPVQYREMVMDIYRNDEYELYKLELREVREEQLVKVDT